MNSPLGKILSDAQEDAASGPGQTGDANSTAATGPLAGPPGAGTSFVSDQLLKIPVTLQVVLGSTRMPLSRIAELRPGSVVNLDQKLGSPATILVNGREVARGELFVLDGEEAQLGITITEVITPGKPSTQS